MREDFEKTRYGQQFGQERFGNRRRDISPIDLDTDWSYLRANLDHPAHRLGNRLGSGLAEWLLRRLHTNSAPAPQLSILARIALGPRQTLALVEAEGMHLLVGTSADGPPSFFSLERGAGTDADRDPNAAPEQEGLPVPGSGANHALGGRRIPFGALAAAGNAPGRLSGRLRLAGRVSWV